MKNEETLDVLYKLRKEILRSDNDDLKSQIDHAIDKTYSDQLSFSFIGHYSAGKSSLINHLLGMEILPSSPVPTTSNTVAVEISEQEEIKAFINQYQYVYLESYEKLRDINAQDVDIQSILLRVSHPEFQLKTVLQDTPGVDSKTKAHSLHTHRFLLNSDYIFFTVEYNHVESEKNLSLLKELVDLNIPVSLIINQVDKHNDEELSFDTFLSRVKQTLSNWDINPERIFTTSIYESPNNQIDALLAFIHEVEKDREQFQAKYHSRIVQNIEDKQLAFLNDKLEMERTEVESNENIDGLTSEFIDTQIKKLEQDKHENDMSAIQSDDESLKSHLKNVTRDIVKNAYLFPHAVKEPITNHLKIRAGDIQVKGFFGKQKKLDQLFLNTEETMDREFAEVFNTQLNSPINTMLIESGLYGESFKFTWQKEHDRSEITTLSNDYILNYLDQLKTEITREVTSQVLIHSETLERTAMTTTHDVNIDAQLKAYQEMKETAYLKQSIETKQYRHFHVRLKEELDKLTFSEALSYEFATEEESDFVEDEQKRNSKDHYSIEVYEQLRDILSGEPRYEQYYSVIDDKISRFYNNKTNLSIFGGFSAGKTTFINALLQDRLLKTSPNPTTATITEVNDHESSVIYKTEEDVIDMLKVITNQNFETTNQYVKWLNRHLNEIHEMHKPFANGLIEKNDYYKSLLGQTVEEDPQVIAEKIASDLDSTFIHKANVRVDNPFTNTFNIIDSPGINSINQRHTNETKDIIVSSDLIVYVSYYNHVFSQSDEDFLKYIKSIKGEDFPIVFIINAIDLMKSETELEKVVQYMKNALRQLNIPYVVLPVSSMRALSNSDEYFNTAKQAIIERAEENKEENQLKSLDVLHRQTMETVISNLNLYENQEEESKRITEIRNESMNTIQSLDIIGVQKVTDVEVDVLLNHLEKQLSLKLYDYLKGQINASDMSNKNYIMKNLTSLKRGIEHFLFIQVATSFNSVYRRADEEINNMLDSINHLLERSHTVEQVQLEASAWEDVDTILDGEVMKQFSKPLYQGRHNFKSFNDTLLQMAQAIAKDVSNDALKQNMLKNTHHYIEAFDTQLEEQKPILIQVLTQPLEKISDANFENDKKLYQQLKEISHDA